METKSVEYYRAAPHSIDLERVGGPVRAMRSPSEPMSPTGPLVVRRKADLPPGPPPQGPLPPLPPRRQSRQEDMASLERSLRRLSRVSVGERAASPAVDYRTEKLLRRLSRHDAVSAPVSPKESELGYLRPAVSVPMRRTVEGLGLTVGVRPLRLKPSANLACQRVSSPDIPDLLSQYRESLAPRPEAAFRESSVFPEATPRASERPASPDIPYILRTTPRPRPSAASLPRRLMSPPSSFRPVSRTPSSRRSSTVTASSAGFDVDGAEVFYGDQYDSADSDSDLDLCTPLPHMMLRAGLLSPRSTIITDVLESPASGLSARGEALRAKGEKVWRQETRRKIRHRDGQNLRDGVGLTTGLGWSDSEDEDAPSPLRRRLSSVLLARAQSRPPSQLSRQSFSTMTLSRRSTCSNLDSTSVSSQSNPRTPASHPLTLPHIPPPLPLSLPLTPSSLPGAMDADEGKLDFPMPPTATSWRGQPSPGLRKQPSGLLRSTSSSTAGGTPCLAPRTRSVSSNSGASQSHTRTSRPPSLAPTSPRLPQLSPRSSLTSRPRPIKVAVRTPSATRLSAPEALRPTDKISPVDTRRMSGT